jgi:hypothetical protein
MANLFLLGAGVSYDTDQQAVEKRQIIQMNGYGDERYVVYDIVKERRGLNYRLINLHTRKYEQCDMIRPLSKKFGIGFYYDDENPQFMDEFEIAILRSEADRIAQAEREAEQKASERNDRLRVEGRERLQRLIPVDAKAIIIAELHENESDPMTDYYGYSTVRTVILGFSTHTRDLFSEMRKYAANFDGTAYLEAENKEYEHREKYSMGSGYYLGASKYSGWIVRKEKFYNQHEQAIERYALTAGDEANIFVKVTAATTETASETVSEAIAGDYIIVDYSDKALAIFGDTKPIKDELKSLGGRFNPKLTHESEKKAGWIFSKSKESELRDLLTVK